MVIQVLLFRSTLYLWDSPTLFHRGVAHLFSALRSSQCPFYNSRRKQLDLRKEKALSKTDYCNRDDAPIPEVYKCFKEKQKKAFLLHGVRKRRRNFVGKAPQGGGEPLAESGCSTRKCFLSVVGPFSECAVKESCSDCSALVLIQI